MSTMLVQPRAHLRVHLPDSRETMIQIVAALWADIDVVDIKRRPAK